MMLSLLSSNKLVKVCIAITSFAVVFKIFYHVFPYEDKTSKISSEFNSLGLVELQKTTDIVTNVPEPLQVTVYYEALCPDSRDFIVRDLAPMYSSIGEIVNVEFVPYGKAQSFRSKDGKLDFSCQHGPRECEANIVHACVLTSLHEAKERVNIVACMIQANFHSNLFFDSARECLQKNGIQANMMMMEECVKGKQGKEFLYHLGRITQDLRPALSFVPTITINKVQHSYFDLIRKFTSVLCDLYEGPRPPGCPKIQNKI